MFCDNIMLAAAIPQEITKRQHEDGGGILQIPGAILNNLRHNILQFFTLNNITGIKPGNIAAKRIVKMDGKDKRLKPLGDRQLRELYQKYRIEYDKDTSTKQP